VVRGGGGQGVPVEVGVQLGGVHAFAVALVEFYDLCGWGWGEVRWGIVWGEGRGGRGGTYAAGFGDFDDGEVWRVVPCHFDVEFFVSDDEDEVDLGGNLGVRSLRRLEGGGALLNASMQALISVCRWSAVPAGPEANEEGVSTMRPAAVPE
jgi:hypothetical protein